ncbi:hypothetical protein OAO87_02130, partial [bacterium]|nr:hypothetical protein [bacterium]
VAMGAVSRGAFIAAAAARVAFEQSAADLQYAAESLHGISKAEWQEIKSLGRPPKPLVDILTCVSLLKGDKPRPATWISIKRSMSNIATFLDALLYVRPEYLDAADVKSVQAILATPDLTPQLVGKFSKAAPLILTWVIALVGCWTKFKVYTSTPGEPGGEAEAEASAQATPTPNPDDVAQAQAALSEALAGLDQVTKMDLMGLRVMKTPPKMMHDVYTCVAALKGEPQPDRWGSILKMVADTGFMQSLHTIGWQDVSERATKRVDVILATPDMTPQAVRKIGGRAGDLLFTWVIALMSLRALMTRPAQAEGEAQERAHKPTHGPLRTLRAYLADGSELVWRHLGGAELEPQLVDAELGAAPIRLVDARYLIALARDGGRLGRRQDLPESAFVPLETLRRLKIGSSNSLRIIVVSHAWLTPWHPDPHGNNLRLLAIALRMMVDDRHDGADAPDELQTYAVMIDFCSAHQKGKCGEARTTQEHALFTRALHGMGDWYSHQDTTVIKLTKLPEGYPIGFDFPDGMVANTADYAGRGWCFEEASVAGLIKSSGKVLDLGQYYKASNLEELKLECKAGRAPPLTPAEFDRQLETKSFTSKKADLAQVQALYLHAYESRLGRVTELWLRELGWADAECEQLISVIRSGVLKELELLVLNHNDIGDDSANLLAAEILNGALPKLKEVSIYGNVRLSSRGLDELGMACKERQVGLITEEA